MDNNNSSQQTAFLRENINLDAMDNKKWQAQFILTILRIACVLGVAFIFVSYPSAASSDRILYIGLLIILLALTLLQIPISIRVISLLSILFTIGIISILAQGPWFNGSIFFLAVIILSAILFDQRVDILALVLSISTILLIAALQQIGFHQSTTLNLPVPSNANWALYIINFSIISAVLIFAIRQFKETLLRKIQVIQVALTSFTSEQTNTETQVREKTLELENLTLQVRSSSSITKTIAEMQDISELMDAATNLTSKQFGYYHVGLYLLDDRKKIAFLQSASSINGKRLVGQGFRIEPDRLNIFNLVIEQKRPHITKDINVNFIPDINFPLTRSRMMMPLTVRGTVIGLMDFHSDQQQSFNSQEVEVLQPLADLVAISIDNVRLINETKNSAYQLESITSQQTRETWGKFTSRHNPGYQFTPAGVRPLFATNRPDSENGLRIPLILHGQNIGGIVLKRKGINAEWSDRERILVEKVANQAALALENSRLVDEAQKNSIRNQVIANISVRIRETLDVESVIRTATTELRRVFDLNEAEISIGGSQVDALPVKRHTSSLRLK